MTETLATSEGTDEHYVAPWCTEDELPAARLAEVDDVQRAFAIACATDLLYVLSGRQFRRGRSVVRPVSIQGAYAYQSFLYPYSSMSGYGDAWGFAAGWSWSAIGMGWWQNGQDTSEVLLQGPVLRINNVLVNGKSLGGWPPSNPNFTLYDRRRLVITIGTTGANVGGWPWNQQLGLPVTSPGTWQIDYEWGRNPPAAGKMAAILLATDIALALSGNNESIPPRVISMAQQGLNVQVGDALNYIREELTGLPYVDMFLKSYNPAGLRRRSVFLGPNSVQGREVS
jgi:hypothetical protein